MSQFSAVDGCMTDWHLMHLGHFAISGAGLVMTEAVYPEARARNGPGCVGLYSDACEAALARVHDFCRENSPAPLGIQIGHAGRKASILPPWQDRAHVPPENGGWEAVGPSAISMGPPYPTPRSLSREGAGGSLCVLRRRDGAGGAHRLRPAGDPRGARISLSPIPVTAQ